MRIMMPFESRVAAMALKATIQKAELNVSDTDRHYYAQHSLTLAQHPSETDERLMVRLAAFALHASDRLAFTRGISTDDEPDLWAHSDSGEIELWIEVGQPDERRIRKACGRAHEVLVYAYSGRGANIWWQGLKDSLARFDNLRVYNIPRDACEALTNLMGRNMQLQATVQDGQLWLADAGGHHAQVEPEQWWPAID